MRRARRGSRIVGQGPHGDFRKSHSRFLAIAFVYLAVFALVGCSEKTTIAPKKIQVVGDRSYAPYEFLEGTVSKGLLVDLWKKWSEKTGVSVDYTLDAWGASQDKVKTGLADAIGGIMRDPEREAHYDFIRQIMSLDEYVYFRSTAFPNGEFSDFHQLLPYVVGIVEEDEAEKMYHRYVPNQALQIKLYPSYSDLVQHAVNGEVDIFLMEQPVARYWLDTLDKARAFQRSNRPIFSQMQYIAVRKGNDALASLINDGFDQLSTQDVTSIRDKWEGYKINITEDDLSVKLERTFQRYFYEIMLLCYLAAMSTIWIGFLIRRPRSLLAVNQKLRELEIPAIEVGPIKGLSSTALRWFFIVAPFEFLPRVLDDWICAREAQVRTSFQSILTVQSKKTFYPVEMTIDGKAINDPNSRDREVKIKETAKKIFSESRALLLLGEGGIGKTSLACWFGQQALLANERRDRTLPNTQIFDHPILPILFDTDIAETDSIKNAARTKISDLVGATISETLLTRLIALNRILVIIDGYSERDVSTQSKFNSLESAARFRRMVITSRSRDATMGLPVAIVEPHRLAGPLIANFLFAYVLTPSVSDEKFYQACAEISVLIRTANVTPLFVALYGQMLNQKASASHLGRPVSQNIPDLVEEYLATINDRAALARREFSSVLVSAKAASWACLQPNLVPGEQEQDAIIRTTTDLGTPLHIDMIGYLATKLGFLINTRGARYKISLDPLAEYLAAMFILESEAASYRGLGGQRQDLWSDLETVVADRANNLQAFPIGFISALLDVARVRRYVLPANIAARLEEWGSVLLKDGRIIEPKR